MKLTGFDPATKKIVLDVGTLFQATDLTAMSMCHSGGPVCPSLFTNVGLDFDGRRAARKRAGLQGRVTRTAVLAAALVAAGATAAFAGCSSEGGVVAPPKRQ